MSSHHINTYARRSPDVLRAVIGGGLFLAACGLLSFGLGHDAAAHRGRDHRRRSACCSC